MNKKLLNQHIGTIANGLLLVWWGLVIIIEPITISMGAIVTGLILLGVNAIRLLNGIQTKKTTTILGLIALTWGVLAMFLTPGFWASFALLLIILGMIEIVSLLMPIKEKLAEGG